MFCKPNSSKATATCSSQLEFNLTILKITNTSYSTAISHALWQKRNCKKVQRITYRQQYPDLFRSFSPFLSVSYTWSAMFALFTVSIQSSAISLLLIVLYTFFKSHFCMLTFHLLVLESDISRSYTKCHTTPEIIY